MPQQTIHVVHFHRWPHYDYAFSIERLFDTVRKHLPPHIQCEAVVMRYPDYRFWRRLYNMITAALRQKDINHITGSVYYLAYLLRKKRTVLSIHDCGSLLSGNGLLKPIRRLLFWVIPVKRCSYIVVISEKTRLEVVTLLPADPTRVCVIPDPVSDDFQPRPKEFNSQKPRILQVRTQENKNLVRVVAALRGIPCHLRIIGKLSSDQEKALHENGIEYSNASGLSNAAMVEEYVHCDLLVFASTYEGFGMPIIEAQAVGRPVVTSRLAPMEEVAGGAACLVDPLDVASIRAGILQIIENQEYRAGLVQRGFENVKRFSPSRIAGQYAALYEKIYSELS